MVHYVFWLFSGGAPASQGGGGGFPMPPSHRAAARRSSNAYPTYYVNVIRSLLQVGLV